jgi:hypothetical protein
VNEEDLRDCFAMFAMLGLIIHGDEVPIKTAYNIADQMIELRKYRDEGIMTIKPKRKAK